MTERITANAVNDGLCKHLDKHKDVYDPRSEMMKKTLYGETNVNGLAGQLKAQGICIDEMAKDITDIKDGIRWLNRLVVGAVILAGMGIILVQ